MIIRKLEVYKPTIFKADQSYYDKDAADMAVNFINCLKHTRVSGLEKNLLDRLAGADYSRCVWDDEA